MRWKSFNYKPLAQIKKKTKRLVAKDAAYGAQGSARLGERAV